MSWPPLCCPAAAAHPIWCTEERAGRLVDVHDAVCADCVRAQRVGVLLLKALELFQALGSLLAAQAHAAQEPLHAVVAWTRAIRAPGRGS